jgi:N-acetylmuramoyl-L-alanine amidase
MKKYLLIIAMMLPLCGGTYTYGVVDYTYINLVKMLHSEADGEIYAGKIAICAVAVNIAKCNKIPLKDVVVNSKLFHGIGTPKYYETPSSYSYRAAYVILSGKVKPFPDNVVYYYNPKTYKNKVWVNKIKKYRYIKVGNHVFCYDPQFKK